MNRSKSTVFPATPKLRGGEQSTVHSKDKFAVHGKKKFLVTGSSFLVRRRIQNPGARIQKKNEEELDTVLR